MCVSRCMLYFLYIGIALLFCHFLYGIKAVKVVKNLIPQTVSAIVMGIVGTIMKLWSDIMILQYLYIIVCILIYFMTLLRFKSMREEIMMLPFVSKLKRIKSNEK